MSFGEKNCKFFNDFCPNPDLSWENFYVCNKDTCEYYINMEIKVNVVLDDESDGNE